MEQFEETPLQPVLRERIRQRGGIPFSDYMAACLYEPGLGYYTSAGRKVGAEGDFYTSINVHQVFGRLIAREIVQMWDVMGRPADFEVVEAGAANGRLARDILDTLAETGQELYAGLTYRLVETEPSLREAQRQMLGEHAAKAAWSEPADMTDGRVTFTGCLLSNELIDALPTHMVEMTAEGVREVYVTTVGETFAEELRPLSTPAIVAQLERVGVQLTIGQRAEVSLAASAWLAGATRALSRGFVLTIDYGYPAAELYAPVRMNGTLLCYYRHTVVEDPYLRPGRQDITSHVDFTNLVRCGEELGLKTVWFGEQYRFLMAVGILEELMALEARAASEEERLKIRLTLKKLILPDGGMGDTFRVLVQAKGVDAPHLLCMREWGKGF